MHMELSHSPLSPVASVSTAITREHSADVAATGLRSYVPVTIPGSAGTFLAHRAFKVPDLPDCKVSGSLACPAGSSMVRAVDAGMTARRLGGIGGLFGCCRWLACS
jgi:hypothetical protein